jgi:hypothetical protein
MSDTTFYLLCALQWEIEIYTIAIKEGIPCHAERERVVNRLREVQG